MKLTRLFPVLLLLSACASTTPLEGVLSGSLEAGGGEQAWANITTLQREGELNFAGLEGTFVSNEGIADARYVTSFELGPYAGAEGFDGKQAWFMDTSGDAVAQDAAGDRQAAHNLAWLAARGYWFPERHPAQMSFKGTDQHDGREFNVIEAVPQGGRPMELWFDAETRHLVRVLEHDGKAVREMTFLDYRPVDGVILPHWIIDLDASTGQAAEQNVREVTINPVFENDAFNMPGSRVADFDWPEHAANIELPFRLVNNHIYTDVYINGKGPLRFMLDTGGLNLLTRNAAERLGIESEGAIKASGTGEKTLDVGVARVETVSLGDLDIHNQTFFVADLSELQDVEGVPFDGLVGFEVFRRFAVRIGYEENRMQLFLPESFTYAGSGTRIPIRLSDRTPETDGSVDGISGVFSIDTGSRSALDLHGPFVRNNGLVERYCPCVETITGWGVGGPVRGRVARVGQLKLGEQEIDDVGVELTLQESGAYADSNLAGNVGGAVLKRFNVIFDYSRNEMILERHAGTGTPDNIDKSGLWINRRGNELLVAAVAEDSAADNAGMQEGDEIVLVDDKPAGEIDLSALRQRLRDEPEGTTVTFRVRRNANERDISITLKNLAK